MNDLQHIDMARFGPVLVTLNPPVEPNPALSQGAWDYEHPVINTEVRDLHSRLCSLVMLSQAVKAQQEIITIQNSRGISYAGAWLGYGFHEDGFSSGLKAALALGDVSLPFELRPPDRRVTHLWLADVFNTLEGIRQFLVSVFGILFRIF